MLRARRPGTSAPLGSAFIRRIWHERGRARERRITREFRRGKIPNFLRRLQPVEVTTRDHPTPDGRTHRLTFHPTPDYLAIGSHEDHVLMPTMLRTAKRVARRYGCILPTARMVEDIYRKTRFHLPRETRGYADHRSERLKAQRASTWICGHWPFPWMRQAAFACKRAG
jgi:hypothetical protein